MHESQDGTQNTFAQALKDFARKGPIRLQGLHGKAQVPVWYRNIKIKELKRCSRHSVRTLCRDSDQTVTFHSSQRFKIARGE